MIEFGNITGGCGGCGTLTVHAVSAHVFRYGWTFRGNSYTPAGGTYVHPGQELSGDFTFNQGKNFATLTVSGLTVSPRNGTYTVDMDTGEGFTSLLETQLFTAWTSEVLDSSWGYGVETQSDTARVYRLYHNEYVGSPVFGFAWVAKHAVTYQMSDEQTDAAAVSACDDLLDGVDFDDVLLFDAAHDFEYIVLRCPHDLAGTSTYDWMCAGDKFSTAAPGDVIILGDPSPTSPPTKIPKISCVSGLRFKPVISGHGARWITHRSRVRVNNPISYSESVYQIPEVERTYSTVTGPQVTDQTWRLAFETPLTVWRPGAQTGADTIERTGTEWTIAGSPACSDTAVTTSSTPVLTFDAPDPTSITNTTHPAGYAVSAARIVRMGIKCSENYPTPL